MQSDTVAPDRQLPYVLRNRRQQHVRSVSYRVPSRRIEYGFFIFLVYSMWSPALGLTIPLLGSGMILVLAAQCARRGMSITGNAYGPASLLVACGGSFIVIQLLIHNESLSGDIRVFGTWVLSVIVVQALCLRRGFLHRCSLVFLLIGVAVLPYLGDISEGVRARVDLEVGGQLTHPVGLAEWFGFCTVYFAIFGLESKRGRTRTIAWVVAIVCLFVVGLTVSRGALLATAIATTVGFRRLLRRGFVPLLGVIVLAGVAYTGGLFDQTVRRYSERGMEDTGRERIWLEVTERVLSSPLIGVGISNVQSFALNRPTAPHNSFLYFALAAGVVPFTLWVAFWVRAFARHRVAAETPAALEQSPFRLPFLLYTLVTVLLGDHGFMSPWALLALAVGAGSGIRHRASRRRRVRTSAHLFPSAAARSAVPSGEGTNHF
jgi:O-antigen ligase